LNPSISDQIAFSSSSTPKVTNMASKALGFLPLLATLTTAIFNPLPQRQTAGQTTTVSITSSGVPLTYLITFPSSYDGETPTPVIFSFHGANRNASQQQELSQFSNATFNDIAIAVYPQGIDVSSIKK
jgi:poly(3-hydroxybutyrate) depolymerase